jgi:carbamoyl-phosphate synthase large subunit
VINVLVTGVSGANTGTQVLSALLACRDKYRLLTCDVSPYSYGAMAGDGFYLVPLASSDEYVSSVLGICRKEDIAVIIPGSEAELRVTASFRDQFTAIGVCLLINNSGVINLCTDKLRTAEFLQRSGFPFPKTVTPPAGQSLEEQIKYLLDRVSFPVVVKPRSVSGGSQNVSIVQDCDELRHILARQGQGVGTTDWIVQEYIGSDDEEYTLGVLSGPDGRAFSSFALRRLIDGTLTRKCRVWNRDRSRIKDEFLCLSTGVSQGWVGDYPEFRSFAETVANALGSTGPLNIQCRRTERGILIFEINPRFSGTTSIRAECGHNDPDLMIRRCVGGEALSQAPYRHGLVVRTLANAFKEGVPP